MPFNLSQKSLDRLEGVNDDMVRVVKKAIELTKVDFGVICGLRTVEEQEEGAGKVAAMAFERGYNVSGRLHCYLFGNAIGT